MLFSLHIENLAIIKNTTIEFEQGFNVLTGETGAGKSLVMKALKMLIGSKVSKDDIRYGEDYAISQGCFTVNDPKAEKALAELDVFPDEEGLIFIERKITSDGKSGCKINERPVPLAKLKSVSQIFLDIHGQNDTKILDEKSRISILDGFGKISLEKYSTSYKEYVEAKNSLEKALSNEENKDLRLDMIKYQLSELTRHSFKEGEEEKLLERSKILKNSEKINHAVVTAVETLKSGNKNAFDMVYDAISALKSVSGIIEEADDIIERLESVKCEIDDIAETVESYGEDASQSEYELDRCESRIHAISSLKRKYSVDFEGLLELIDTLKEEQEVLKDSENNIKKLKLKCKDLKKEAEEQGSAVSKLRIKASLDLESAVKKHLEGLGMPAFRFKIEISPKELSTDGCDDVKFLISTNAGEEFKALEKTASGGELSRFMLALKSAFSEEDGVFTMVFDEIDTGISGKTSEKLGIKLKSLSKNNKQVICVTHSAQVAAIANKHFLIAKEEKDGRTTSKATPLSNEERVEEISRIMGGIQITQTVYSAAKEMLDNGRNS